MGQHDKFIVSWAEGAGRNLAKADNKTGGWAELCKKLSSPTRTRERYKAFMAMSRDEQLRLKSTNGWISGAQCEGKWRNLRNVKPRDLMTLDLDYPNPGFLDQVEMGATPISQFEFFALTTRSHSPEKPRVRVVLPMKRKVTPDEYSPLVRILAFLIDNETQPMRQVDVVSSRKAQMMFYPTASVDGVFWSFRNEGSLLDPDALLDWYEETHGDWRDLAALPLFTGEDQLRKHADKAEDPLLKVGPVGHWCRAYSVEDIIANFLPDIYVPGDTQSAKPRYTYTGGSASNGAVVEDDGRFLYSHHGTDPVGEQLVNSWDLYRVHKFGELDDGISTDTPMGQRPSWKAMMEFAKADPKFHQQVIKSRYDLGAMFEDVDDDYFNLPADEEPEIAIPITEPEGVDEPEYTDSAIRDDIEDLVGLGAASAAVVAPRRARPQAERPPKDWFGTELEIDQNGNLKSTIHNIATIVHNDARFWGAICFDEFSQQIVVRRDIKSKTKVVPERIVRDKVKGDRWQDSDDISIRAILAAPNGEGKTGYGLGTVSERDINGAVVLASRRHRFHPVKDYLEDLVWDGVPRVERLFIDHLGAVNTPYHREAAFAVMVASVARIYEPGHKFDFAPVISGTQGKLKSTFIETLYGESWFGEISCKLNDTQQIAETIGGKWGMEFPELAAFYKSDHNDAKQFMSRKVDSVRMAYDRRITDFPRQAIFWGTTNDRKYLKDPTGNRRWWPIVVHVDLIDIAALIGIKDQLWAEAVALYRSMREEQPHGTLPLFLRSEEAQTEAASLQEEARTQTLPEVWAETIQQWLAKPVTLATLALQYQKESAYLAPAITDPDHTWVVRTAFRVADAAKHALELQEVIHNDQMTQNLDRAVTLLDDWANEKMLYPDRINAVRRFGIQGRWKLLSGASERDHTFGFRVVPTPDDVGDIDTASMFTDDDLL